MKKPCRKCAPKASSRPLFNFGKQPKTGIACREFFYKQIFGNRIISESFKKINFIFLSNRKSSVCHLYVTRMYSMSFVCTCLLSLCHSYVLECTRMSSVCHSCVLVCHPYVTRMYSYVIRISLVCTCMYSYVIRMSLVCHSYILVCHPYVSHMYSCVIRKSLVCGFTMNHFFHGASFVLIRGNI